MTNQRPETLEEAAEALKDGRLVWADGVPIGPKETLMYAKEHLSSYRIKNKPLNPVDLSELVDGIDCEFWEQSEKAVYVGTLVGTFVGDNLRYVLKGVGNFKYCRPRMNCIHAHQGGECPLPVGLKIWVKEWSGREIHGVHPDHPNINWPEVAQFEVLGLMDGFCWPWEV